MWQYCRNNGAIIDFDAANTTDSFNFKEKLTGQADDNCTKNIERLIPIKYLSNFYRTHEMPYFDLLCKLYYSFLLLFQIKVQTLQRLTQT